MRDPARDADPAAGIAAEAGVCLTPYRSEGFKFSTHPLLDVKVRAFA